MPAFWSHQNQQKALSSLHPERVATAIAAQLSEHVGAELTLVALLLLAGITAGVAALLPFAAAAAIRVNLR